MPRHSESQMSADPKGNPHGLGGGGGALVPTFRSAASAGDAKAMAATTDKTTFFIFSPFSFTPLPSAPHWAFSAPSQPQDPVGMDGALRLKPTNILIKPGKPNPSAFAVFLCVERLFPFERICVWQFDHSQMTGTPGNRRSGRF